MNKEKNFKFLYFLLIFSFLEPALFREFNIIHKIFMIIKSLTGIIIIVNYIFYYLLKGKTSKMMILIFIFELELLFSTIINNGDINACLSSIFSIITISMLVEYGIDKYPKDTFRIVYQVFSLYTIINLIDLLVKTKFVPKVNGSIIFFLGIDNRFIFIFLPMIGFGLLYKTLDNRNYNNVIIMTLIAGLTLLYCWSVGALFGIFILIIYEFFFLDKNNRHFKYNLLFLFIIILNVIFIFCKLENIVPLYIFDFLGKDVTLSGRTYLWDAGIKYIGLNPIFGYGINGYLIKDLLYGLEHFHNYLINITFQGGIVELIIFFIINIYASMLVKNAKNIRIANILTILIFVCLFLDISDTLDYTYFYIFYIILGSINKLGGKENE